LEAVNNVGGTHAVVQGAVVNEIVSVHELVVAVPDEFGQTV
jgi:hypothetical protein